MPIHNEEAHLSSAIARVPAYVDRIIAVDDGSDDDTWRCLGRIESGRLIRLRHGVNRGVGAATKTGYRRALEDRVELIAVMDGDGQMDGDDLCRLLDAAIGGADYVKGNRFLHRTISEMPVARFVGNRMFSLLTRWAADLRPAIDAQCGYAIVRAAALRRIDLGALYDRYGFLNDLLFAIARARLRVESVPVRCIYGNEISGINPVIVVPVIVYLNVRNYLRRAASVLFETRPDRATLLAIRSQETSAE